MTVLQTVCLPVGPRCDLCDLSSNGLCPSARKGGKSKRHKALVPTEELSGQTIEVEGNDPEEPAVALNSSGSQARS